MSISSRKIVVSLVAAALAAASAGAFAQDRYDDRPYDDRPYDQDRYDQDRYDGRYDDRDDAYDYARVVDVQPLVTRCASARRSANAGMKPAYDNRGYGNGPLPRTPPAARCSAPSIGAVIGHQIGHGQRPRCRDGGGCGRRCRGRLAAGAAPRGRTLRAPAARVHGAALRDALPAMNGRSAPTAIA